MNRGAVLFLVLVLVAIEAAKVSYRGEPVIIAHVETESQLEGLRSYQDESLNVFAHDVNESVGAFDVWSRGSNLALGRNDIHIRKPVDVNLAVFKKLNIKYEYMMNDVQEAIDQQNVVAPKQDGADTWFDSYHTYEAIVNKAESLCALRTDICTYNGSIYTSVQGRSVIALHLFGGDDKAAATKQQIFINGGQHAREWIAPSSVMYILSNLITNYGVNTTITKLIDNVEIIIVPIANPDGYDWSWTNDRLWRKNRRNNGAGYTLGVDLNRNWDDHWGKGGSSTNPNSDTYMGKSAFSEPESKGLASYFLAHRVDERVAFYIDYHCYSQLVLYAYGWTSAAPPNLAALKNASAGIVNAIRTTPKGVVYTAQSSYALYITTGSAQDWFYSPDGGNVPMSFTLEGRDTGRYGFVLPASEIVISGQENWNAFVWLAQHLVKL